MLNLIKNMFRRERNSQTVIKKYYISRLNEKNIIATEDFKSYLEALDDVLNLLKNRKDCQTAYNIVNKHKASVLLGIQTQTKTTTATRRKRAR